MQVFQNPVTYRRFPRDTETPDNPEFQYVGRQLRFVY